MWYSALHWTVVVYATSISACDLTWGNAELAWPASWKIKMTAIKIRSGFKTLGVVQKLLWQYFDVFLTTYLP